MRLKLHLNIFPCGGSSYKPLADKLEPRLALEVGGVRDVLQDNTREKERGYVFPADQAPNKRLRFVVARLTVNHCADYRLPLAKGSSALHAGGHFCRGRSRHGHENGRQKAEVGAWRETLVDDLPEKVFKLLLSLLCGDDLHKLSVYGHSVLRVLFGNNFHELLVDRRSVERLLLIVLTVCSAAEEIYIVGENITQAVKLRLFDNTVRPESDAEVKFCGFGFTQFFFCRVQYLSQVSSETLWRYHEHMLPLRQRLLF